MAVPKKKTSKRRKGMRRANDYLTFNERITYCENCGTDVLLHHVCETCGFYKGKKILQGKEDISGSVIDSDSTVSAEELETPLQSDQEDSQE